MTLQIHLLQCEYNVICQDGSIQKTIEHYTFADSQSTATITVEADKAIPAIPPDVHTFSIVDFPESSIQHHQPHQDLVEMLEAQDLYEGASEHVKEEQIEAWRRDVSWVCSCVVHCFAWFLAENSDLVICQVLSKDKELVVILHGVPTMKAAWVSIFYSAEPSRAPSNLFGVE